MLTLQIARKIGKQRKDEEESHSSSSNHHTHTHTQKVIHVEKVKIIEKEVEKKESPKKSEKKDDKPYTVTNKFNKEVRMVTCTLCDGNITLTSDEWAAKGLKNCEKSDCKKCNGTGYITELVEKKEVEIITCTLCEGKVTLSSDEWAAKGFKINCKSFDCKRCNGTGKMTSFK